MRQALETRIKQIGKTSDFLSMCVITDSRPQWPGGINWCAVLYKSNTQKQWVQIPLGARIPALVPSLYCSVLVNELRFAHSALPDSCKQKTKIRKSWEPASLWAPSATDTNQQSRTEHCLITDFYKCIVSVTYPVTVTNCKGTRYLLQ
jgi:hypothetical protein